MKLSAAVDLTSAKTAAVATLDLAYDGLFRNANKMDDLYRVKTALAQAAQAGAPPDPSLTAEANLKGVTVAVLCAEILAKRTTQIAAVTALETARQTAKSQIAAITDQHTLNTTMTTIMKGLQS